MESFPFTAQEWSKVQQVTHKVLNATLADDDLLRASHFVALQSVLDELRRNYGDHPILLETEGDFSDDPRQQRELYRRAIWLAEENTLPTLSIRISLARVLLQDFGDPDEAARELTACEYEWRISDDQSERRNWAEAMSECKRKAKGKTKGHESL